MTTSLITVKKKATNPDTRLNFLSAPRAMTGKAEASVMRTGMTNMKRNHAKGVTWAGPKPKKFPREVRNAKNKIPVAQRISKKPAKPLPITRVSLCVFIMFIIRKAMLSIRA